jgi:uncharacterized protein YndB with AHSA1/START domain
MTKIDAGPRTTVNLEGDCDLTVSRVFDAPRELVFKAWTEPERLMAWWGPREWPLAVCKVDLRAGGRWHYCMRGPNGEEAWGLGQYKEIDPPKRLVLTDNFSNAAGDAIPPASVMTVEFEDLGGRTLLKSRSVFDSPEHRDTVLGMGMVEGMTESLDRLEEHLAA